VTEPKLSDKALLTYLLFKSFPKYLTSASDPVYLMEFSLFMILLAYCIGFSTVIFFFEFVWHFEMYGMRIRGKIE